MKKNCKGKITKVDKVSIDTMRLDISSNTDKPSPGQFISVLCPNKTLRRPFSIAGFENDVLSILVKLKGEGTAYLQSLKEGDDIDFIGPLGRGFELKNKKSLLVGAGIGIAPMLYLKEELNKKNIENYLISGFKNKEEVIEGSDETVIGGSVLDNLEELIKEKNIEIIYACGPAVVLRAISKLPVPSQIAMERVMACSIGVCRGCVIKTKKDEQTVYASVCKDGPVFRGSDIIWD